MDKAFDINLNININVKLENVPELVKAIAASFVMAEGEGADPGKETAPQPQPEAQPQPAEDMPGEQDLREAMRRTRRRIEGEDYENNPDSEGYVKYHKALSSWFRRLAETVGQVGKPIQLPPEKRAAFIRECDNTVLSEAGELEIRREF